MDFKDIVVISGERILHRMVKPTRNGVILESIDENKNKCVIIMHNKLSFLHEISIYSTCEKGLIGMYEIMKKINQKFEGQTIGIEKNKNAAKLKEFMKSILPNYDEERVYISDIKKVINWYEQLRQYALEVLIENENK